MLESVRREVSSGGQQLPSRSPWGGEQGAPWSALTYGRNLFWTDYPHLHPQTQQSQGESPSLPWTEIITFGPPGQFGKSTQFQTSQYFCLVLCGDLRGPVRPALLCTCPPSPQGGTPAVPAPGGGPVTSQNPVVIALIYDTR